MFKKRNVERELRELRAEPTDDFLRSQVGKIGRNDWSPLVPIGARLGAAAVLIAGALVLAFGFGGAIRSMPQTLSGVFAADATESLPPHVNTCTEPGSSGNYTVTGTYSDPVQTVTIELLLSGQRIASFTFTPSGGPMTFSHLFTTTHGKDAVHARVIQGNVVSPENLACT